jgi:acyl transferase domain-containing protein
MVATHLGRQHLAGVGGSAVAAGVNLMLAETTTAAAHAAGMLTPDGRCKALDASADGYVRSEACVVLLLTAAAAANGADASGGGGQGPDDFSGAVLRSSYVNQDGRSSSLTAPHGPSQQQVPAAAHPDIALSLL